MGWQSDRRGALGAAGRRRGRGWWRRERRPQPPVCLRAARHETPTSRPMAEAPELTAPVHDVPAVPAARFLAARAALAALEQRVADIRATVVASRDGLPVAATLPDADAARLAAMAASVL